MRRNLWELVFEIVAHTAGGRKVGTGDTESIKFFAEAFDGFVDGGEGEFFLIGENEVTDFVESERGGRFSEEGLDDF